MNLLLETHEILFFDYNAIKLSKAILLDDLKIYDCSKQSCEVGMDVTCDSTRMILIKSSIMYILQSP